MQTGVMDTGSDRKTRVSDLACLSKKIVLIPRNHPDDKLFGLKTAAGR